MTKLFGAAAALSAALALGACQDPYGQDYYTYNQNQRALGGAAIGGLGGAALGAALGGGQGA
ncbi:MAG: hypothetical protein K2X11_16210, partial [Acetobacteraceae bacterium]|nr:hypothetical protein [Acetobacteraceae bacterium]